MHALNGQTAIITGVGGGFGREIALALARAGASVTMTARSATEIESVKQLIEQEGGRALAVTGDVTIPADVQRVFAAHKAAFGAPSILVNNASVTDPYGPIGEIDPAAWWRTMGVHVLGALHYITAALPDMRAADKGCIINISSMDATIVRAHQSAYCVAKSALNRLTEHVAAEQAGSGVAIFAVHPGVGMSPGADQMRQSEDAKKWLPEFMALFEQLKAMGEWRDDFVRCGARCVDLASGRFNHLSGRFINFQEFDPAAEARA